MKDVLSYCKKIIESTNESTKNTETTLRNLTQNQEFLNIEKILKTKCRSYQMSDASMEIQKVQLSKI